MSTLVLQEFCVDVTRKILRPLSGAAAREVVRNYACWAHSPITPATVIRASEIGETLRNMEAVLLGQHDRCRR